MMICDHVVCSSTIARVDWSQKKEFCLTLKAILGSLLSFSQHSHSFHERPFSFVKLTLSFQQALQLGEELLLFVYRQGCKKSHSSSCRSTSWSIAKTLSYLSTSPLSIFQPKFQLKIINQQTHLKYLNVSGDAILIKSLLQYLVVCYEFMLKLCLPIDLVHWYTPWEQNINNLAVDCSCGTLFNLSQMKLLGKVRWVT